MHSSSSVLLAIDTSTRIVGLALYDGVQMLSEATWTSLDYHTVELAPAIYEALSKTNVAPQHLGALAVALGPGSFTGLRIGMALAKGLALARRLPIIGIPTLDILVASQPVCQTPLVAVLRAGRGRLAVGCYEAQGNAWQMVKDVQALTPEEMVNQIGQPSFICGELSAEERGLFASKLPGVALASPAQSSRRPGFLAELAWKRWKAGLIEDPASLSPIYLHYNDPIPG